MRERKDLENSLPDDILAGQNLVGWLINGYAMPEFAPP
mgnify:CR=1 FL=1